MKNNFIVIMRNVVNFYNGQHVIIQNQHNIITTKKNCFFYSTLR